MLKTYDIKNTDTYPDGRNTSLLAQTYEYDLIGNVKTYKDAKGETTNFYYNALNQTTRVKYPEPSVGEYNTTSYGKNGKPTFGKQYSDDNHSVANIYNAYNFLIFRTDFAPNAAMQMEYYSYSPTGNIIKKTDKNSNITLYHYDSVQNLILSETAEDTINYYYSPFGNIILYDYTGHTTLEKGEDNFGRINIRTEGILPPIILMIIMVIRYLRAMNPLPMISVIKWYHQL